LDLLDYEVTVKVIDSSPWVPQRRNRTFIVGIDRRQLPGVAFQFRKPPDTSHCLGEILEPEVLAKYTLTPALWKYLQDYAKVHREKGNGFGYGLVDAGSVTRTLSARYYKDGSEILVRQGSLPPRRLTPVEAGRLMGFPDPRVVRGSGDVELEPPPLTSFRIPVADRHAYRQFGNSVVVPVVEWLASELVEQIKFPARGQERH
jgi:DNA (cytosine-5)-methyltransferase 1